MLHTKNLFPGVYEKLVGSVSKMDLLIVMSSYLLDLVFFFIFPLITLF